MSIYHALLVTAMAMTSQPSSQDSVGSGSQAEFADTCQVCTKSAGVKCTTAIKCAKCSVPCHVSCLVNDFVSSYSSPRKSSLQWLADFLRTEVFSVCITCRGQSSTRDFTFSLAIEIPPRTFQLNSLPLELRISIAKCCQSKAC